MSIFNKKFRLRVVHHNAEIPGQIDNPKQIKTSDEIEKPNLENLAEAFENIRNTVEHDPDRRPDEIRQTREGGVTALQEQFNQARSIFQKINGSKVAEILFEKTDQLGKNAKDVAQSVVTNGLNVGKSALENIKNKYKKEILKLRLSVGLNNSRSISSAVEENSGISTSNQEITSLQQRSESANQQSQNEKGDLLWGTVHLPWGNRAKARGESRELTKTARKLEYKVGELKRSLEQKIPELTGVCEAYYGEIKEYYGAGGKFSDIVGSEKVKSLAGLASIPELAHYYYAIIHNLTPQEALLDMKKEKNMPTTAGQDSQNNNLERSDHTANAEEKSKNNNLTGENTVIKNEDFSENSEAEPDTRISQFGGSTEKINELVKLSNLPTSLNHETLLGPDNKLNKQGLEYQEYVSEMDKNGFGGLFNMPSGTPR